MFTHSSNHYLMAKEIGYASLLHSQNFPAELFYLQVSNLANTSSLIYNALLAFPAHFGSEPEKAVNWCGMAVINSIDLCDPDFSQVFTSTHTGFRGPVLSCISRTNVSCSDHSVESQLVSSSMSPPADLAVYVPMRSCMQKPNWSPMLKAILDI